MNEVGYEILGDAGNAGNAGFPVRSTGSRTWRTYGRHS
jgi:hypothetical protein